MEAVWRFEMGVQALHPGQPGHLGQALALGSCVFQTWRFGGTCELQPLALNPHLPWGSAHSWVMGAVLCHSRIWGSLPAAVVTPAPGTFCSWSVFSNFSHQWQRHLQEAHQFCAILESVLVLCALRPLSAGTSEVRFGFEMMETRSTFNCVM